jgi:hypothetical protein
VTRFISADELIGGLPAREVRDALRRLGSRQFDAAVLAAALHPERSEAAGRALLGALIADALVEEVESNWWRTTRAGVLRSREDHCGRDG